MARVDNGGNLVDIFSEDDPRAADASIEIKRNQVENQIPLA